MNRMKQYQITVKTYPIRLGQFLKLAEISNDGIEAKHLIGSGKVFVNGIIDTRRGRQLVEDDLVTVNDVSYRCA